MRAWEWIWGRVTSLWRRCAAPPHEDEGAYRVVPRTLWVLFSIVWFFFLIYPLSALLQARRPAQLALGLIGMVALIALFLWLMLWRPFWRLLARASAQRAGTSSGPLAALSALTLLIILLTLTNSVDWIWFMFYAAMTAGVALPTPLAARTTIALMALTLALGWITLGWPDTGRFVLLVAFGGFGMLGVGLLISTVSELRAAREEIARLAVADERLRIARDLHDALGQSLSLIALKSEVAELLIPTAPEQAQTAAHEVAAVARSSLQEVRAVVADYRRPDLARELHAADEILSAAGIACQRDDAPAALPADADATLGWVVREGITNVVRHSRATRCEIRFIRNIGMVGVVVRDNGQGISSATPGANETHGAAHGSGLAGLAERVAAVGGHSEVGRCEDSGFQLVVTVPIGTLTQGAPQ